MKRIITLLTLLTVTVTSGCAGNPELIRASITSTRSDVFQELADGGSIPQGYTDLRITSSLKTHKPGIYSLEKKAHGTPDYKLLINIDGQATVVSGSLQEENIEPRGLRDPEAGEGIRYLFRKDLRLKAGTHNIMVAIPEDGIAIEHEIALKEGSVNTLVPEPIYRVTAARRLPVTYSESSFLKGLGGFRMVLNGKPL